MLTVEFTVLGIPCLGLNGGPAFKHSEAFSSQIATENQEETDRYWNTIVGNGGTESACESVLSLAGNHELAVRCELTLDLIVSEDASTFRIPTSHQRRSRTGR